MLISEMAMRVLVIFLLTQIITGCSILNLLYDEHQVFIDARNSEVGKKLKDVLRSTHYYDYWEDNKSYSSHKNIITIPSDSAHTEYYFNSRLCNWALNIENESSIVVEWRFTAGEAECKYKRFYASPF